MKNYARYSNIVTNSRKRYTQADTNGKHYVNRSIGGVPSRYTHIETLAAAKYLGCDINRLQGSSDYANAPSDLTLWRLPV